MFMRNGVSNLKLIKKKNLLLHILNTLFLLSLPMMPIFTRKGYYILGLLVGAITFIIYLRKGFKLSSFEKMEIVFTICILASLLYSYNLNSSIEVLTKNIRIVIFASVAIRMTFIINRDVKVSIYTIGKCFVIGTLLISIYIYFAEFGMRRINNRYGEIVFSKEYGTYITYSYNLIISMCMLIYNQFYNCKNNKEKIQNIIIIFVIGYFTLISGTRKAVVIPIIFAIMIIASKNRKNIIKLIKYGILFSVFIILIYNIIMNVDSLYSIIGHRMESLLLGTSSVQDNSMIERELMREYAWQLFLQKPIIGNGAGTFRDFFVNISGKYLYSHNNHLELLSSLGLIGYSVFYGWIFFILCKLYSLIRKGDNISIGLFSFIIIQVILDYGTVSYNNEQYILIYSLAAFYCHKKQFINKTLI